MKLVSWNVNGIRAAMKKDFVQSFATLAPDVLCLQETKAQDDQVFEALDWLDDYHLYSNCAEKKGYSGTAIITRVDPIDVTSGMGIPKHDNEGRILTAEFESFFLVTVYTPNSKSELLRLDYRQQWDADFLVYLQGLEKKKPVVVCGDLNVAHQAIDLTHPKPNYNKNPGYTQTEIDGFDGFMQAGFVDSWRQQHPDTVKYSWWSYRANARTNNVGWRIDYFLASNSIKEKINSTEIHNDIHGSDHCPVSLTLSA